MKKSFVKELTVLVILTVLGRTMPAYGGWQQQDKFWQYEKDGAWLKNDWVHDLGDWYHLDADGVMETGWKQIGGFWYFFNPVSDGTCGRMLTGWQWIDGKCYCLAQEDGLTHPKGAMYANGQTPDGYWVDETGAWVDERGEVVEIPGKGILTGRSEDVKLSGTAKMGLGDGDGNGSGSGSGSGGSGSGSGGSGSGSGGSGSRSGGSGSRKGSGSKSGNDSKSGSGGSESVDKSGNDSKSGSRGGESGGKNGSGNRNEERESEDRSDLTGTEKTEEPATASNAAQVNWYVHFADKSTHQALLAETRQGKIQDGERLVLNFRNRIVDQENRLWESVEQSPLEMEVYGPGDWIYYVEYVQTGEQREPEDIFEEDRVRLRSWLDTGKRQESAATGEDISDIPDTRFLVGDQKDADGRLLTIAGQIPLSGEYSVYLIGKNHEPEGRILKNYFGDGIVYSKLVEDRFSLEGDVYTVVRFSLKRSQEQDREDGSQEEKTDFENSWEKIHWNMGDVLTGEIDGEMYNFRCIDQNYSDLAGNHREGALFFCDSVIPADIGSSYVYEPAEDGGYEYVFYPGPVVNFGKENDYKYSNVHMWLQTWEENFKRAKDIDIGISRAYTGSTGDGMYSQLKASELKGYPIGNQKLTGKLFALSVDEALKYRDWLWKFDGSEEENPESQTGMFSKGYWLRNPMGTTQNHDTGFVYAVDLEGGKICPVRIGPDKSAEDEELQVTGVIGVRPAFVMPLQ